MLVPNLQKILQDVALGFQWETYHSITCTGWQEILLSAPQVRRVSIIVFLFYLPLCFEERSKMLIELARRAELPDLYIGQCKTKTLDFRLGVRPGVKCRL